MIRTPPTRRPSTAEPAAEPAADDASPRRLGRTLYRYFFYGWLFGDTEAGSATDRTRAIGINRDRARWLPVYLRRWATLGAIVGVLGRCSETLWPHPALAALFAVAMTFVVVQLTITAICWAFLRDPRRRR
ncbi:MAG: hypothetical protein JSR59_09505 [Proteobacteria bacterium]|nr:hypothetical protein [Pseudomonadota bacterium]